MYQKLCQNFNYYITLENIYQRTLTYLEECRQNNEKLLKNSLKSKKTPENYLITSKRELKYR